MCIHLNLMIFTKIIRGFISAWHPLLTGSKAAMHGERISVRHIAVKESEVIDWQDHILNKPDWAQ